MHIVIDAMAVVGLLFFLMSGWRKGSLLSLLGVVRVVLAYGVAYLAGRYLGYWVGEVANRPRIVTIPVIAGLTFALISFGFHVVMWEIRAHHQHREKKENFRLPWYSRLGGGSINLLAGFFSMVFLFWLGDLFMVGVSGHQIPGAGQSWFAQTARRVVYEGTYRSTAWKGDASRSAALARVVSNPAAGMAYLKNILAAESVQQLISSPSFAETLLSGDPARIEQSPEMQQLFNDRATLDELRDLGILSGQEKKADLCVRLSRFGSNPAIQASLQNLKAKQLLSTDKIAILIRDPDFDAIVAELVK